MAKLIERIESDEWGNPEELWYVSERLNIVIYFDDKDGENILFVRDNEVIRENRFNSLVVLPSLLKDLSLKKNYGVSIWPSIDTSGLLVGKEHTQKVFDLLEEYLLKNYN